MSETRIEWADASWSPVTGCSKVSAGCKNCYAERFAQRLRGHAGYPPGDPFRVTTHPDRLGQPLHWRKPRRIFVCSMGDLFHEAVEVGFICRVLAVVALSPRHTFIVLTKRPKGALDILTWISGKPADLLSDAAGADWSEDAECQVANAINGVLGAGHNVGWPMRNLWLGVSCENQNAAEDRIPILLRTPAALRFVSVEPMLGPVDPFLPARAAGLRPPHWVICGGETGPGARPMDPHWARTLRDQCRDADVPFFFKRHNGRKIEGDRLLDGELWHQFPADRRS